MGHGLSMADWGYDVTERGYINVLWIVLIHKIWTMKRDLPLSGRAKFVCRAFLSINQTISRSSSEKHSCLGVGLIEGRLNSLILRGIIGWR